MRMPRISTTTGVAIPTSARTTEHNRLLYARLFNKKQVRFRKAVASIVRILLGKMDSESDREHTYFGDTD